MVLSRFSGFLLKSLLIILTVENSFRIQKMSGQRKGMVCFNKEESWRDFKKNSR